MSTMVITPMSEKQRRFVRSLLDERDLTGFPEVDVDALDHNSVRPVIDALLRLPKKAPRRAPEAIPAVPEGRYAVQVPGDAQLAFFTVSRPERGRWAGFVFLNQLASDHEWPVRGARRSLVLDLIAADYKAAGALYGQKIGRCCRCGRTLTDEASREAGIGPDCAGKF